jgi:hypothetical protein
MDDSVVGNSSRTGRQRQVNDRDTNSDVLLIATARRHRRRPEEDAAVVFVG